MLSHEHNHFMCFVCHKTHGVSIKSGFPELLCYRVFHLHLDTFYGKYHSLKSRIPAKEARGSWSMYSHIILFCGDQVRICVWSAVRVLVIPISFYDSFTVQPSSTRLSIRPIDRDIYRILIVSGSLLLTWCFIGHNKTDKNVVLSLNLEHFLSSVRIQQGRTGICQNRGVFYCRKERREVTFVGDLREADF